MQQKEMTAARKTTAINDDAKVLNLPEKAKQCAENLFGGVAKLMVDYNQLKEKKDVHPEPSNDVPFFVVRSANDYLQEASATPPPQPLWLTLWHEGEICCLFANSGAGKSIYAVQMGATIAQNTKVLYFDFELTDQQFATRYSSDVWNSHTFPPNFYRVAVNADYIAVNGIPDLMAKIEQTTLEAGADVIIIDNLTWVATATEKADEAGKLMQRFMRLKKVYGWSILLLAHTPKRDKQQPLSENDLAGSRVLYNFLDSSFCIGQSARGDEYRYIKQVKTRQGAKEYGANHVIVTRIIKDNGFTHHQAVGYSTEELELGTRRSPKDGSDSMREVFARLMDGKELRYTDLVQSLQCSIKKHNGDSIGERTAKDYVKTAFSWGIITKNRDGNYVLSAKVQK